MNFAAFFISSILFIFVNCILIWQEWQTFLKIDPVQSRFYADALTRQLTPNTQPEHKNRGQSLLPLFSTSIR